MVALLGGCSTEHVTEASQSPVEQLAMSTAVDHAVENLKVELAANTKVFVDGSLIDSTDKGIVLPKYTIGAVHDLILRAGADLVDDRKAADVIAELRSGAQSVDHRSLLVGLPSFSIPVPLAGPLTTPEMAVFKRDQQRGICKIALTLYSARSGALAGATGASYGDSRYVRYSALLVFTWTDQDILPDHIPAPSGEAAERGVQANHQPR
jgi:hypothetical protein